MAMTSKSQRAELRALALSATPGTYEIRVTDECAQIETAGGDVVAKLYGTKKRREAFATFIVLARASVAALAEDVDTLTVKLRETREEIAALTQRLSDKHRLAEVLLDKARGVDQVLRAMLTALPTCEQCEAIATRALHGSAHYCDQHAIGYEHATDLPYADVIRRLGGD